MLEQLQNIDQIKEWHSYIPFAALVARAPVPENRPAMTRIIEQGVVGILAALLGSYVTLHVHQAEIDNLKAQRVESEARLTSQITEIRQLLIQSLQQK